MARKVAFLDRDGTINVDRGYVIRVEDFQFVDHAADAIKLFAKSGFAIAVITNQSAIGNHLCTQDDVDLLHEHLRQRLSVVGVEIDAIAVCPHLETDGCNCRKPRIGLADIIEKQLGQAINYGDSWVVGDKPSDIEFGEILGTNTSLIRSRYWQAKPFGCNPTMIVDSLWNAALGIVSSGEITISE